MFAWLFWIVAWLVRKLGGVGPETDWTEDDIPSLEGKTTIVTGVSPGGIGFECARALWQSGCHVYVLSRDEGKASAAMSAIESLNPAPGKPNGKLTYVNFDLTDISSCVKAANHLDKVCDKCDIVIANAGIMAWPYKLINGVEVTFYNHLGHFAFIEALRPLLERSSQSVSPRIVVLTSNTHEYCSRPNFRSLKDVNARLSSSTARYARSKLANLLFVRTLSQRLNDTRHPVRAICVHPGPVASQLFRGTAQSFNMIPRFEQWLNWFVSLVIMTPQQGARTVLWAATADQVDQLDLRNAYVIPFGHVVAPSALAQDDALAEDLWTTSEYLVRRLR